MLNPNKGKKIAISGSYNTGKSTLIKDLGDLTGLPVIQPKEAPEIFTELFDGVSINQGTQEQFVQTGLARLLDRIGNEKLYHNSGFIADGTALTEWAYGVTRQEHGHGAHGPGVPFTSPEYKWLLEQLEAVATNHCSSSYDSIIHLPVEFNMNRSNSEGIDEPFRRKADDIIRGRLDKIGIDYHVISGNHDERVAKTMDILDLAIMPQVCDPVTDGDTMHFDYVDNVLGPSQERWFSEGFRRANHKIHDVNIDHKLGSATAKLDVLYSGAWSKHNGCERSDVHLSSVDVILALGQLSQAYMLTKDGFKRDDSRNMWLRELNIKIRKPVTDMKNIHIEAYIDSCYPQMGDSKYHVATADAIIGGGAFKVKGKLCYQMPV